MLESWVECETAVDLLYQETPIAMRLEPDCHGIPSVRVEVPNGCFVPHCPLALVYDSVVVMATVIGVEMAVVMAAVVLVVVAVVAVAGVA